MTTEVAILNKEGVALASDSIVTVSSESGRKTYPASNKLFTLSKHHPVGILIYGSTETHTVPVEIAIKEFRARLASRQHERLETYSSTFLSFLASFLPTGSAEDKRNFRAVIDSYARRMRSKFFELCEENSLPINGGPLVGKRGELLDDVLDEWEGDIKGAKPNPAMVGLKESDILSAYPDIVQGRFKLWFDKFPISRRINRMTDLAAKAVLIDKASSGSTGIVISGYGRDEYYPSICPHEVDGLICGRLKIVSADTVPVTDVVRACIYPFAQRGAADLFIMGVDSAYQTFINDGIDDIIPGIADLAAKYFGITNRPKTARFKRKLRDKAEAFKDEMLKERRESSRDRILDAVEFLGRAELAALAESLVSISALKQKVSLDLETVGGEIDVAVISKHDGFIWIKRKHYFNPIYNTSFPARYLLDHPTSSKGVT